MLHFAKMLLILLPPYSPPLSRTHHGQNPVPSHTAEKQAYSSTLHESQCMPKIRDAFCKSVFLAVRQALPTEPCRRSPGSRLPTRKHRGTTTDDSHSSAWQGFVLHGAWQRRGGIAMVPGGPVSSNRGERSSRPKVIWSVACCNVAGTRMLA